tara:strand:- start:1491 stop:2462 length:972 start_codon:yes stop_codon:yes gene_type:complete
MTGQSRMEHLGGGNIFDKLAAKAFDKSVDALKSSEKVQDITQKTMNDGKYILQNVDETGRNSRLTNNPSVVNNLRDTRGRHKRQADARNARKELARQSEQIPESSSSTDSSAPTGPESASTPDASLPPPPVQLNRQSRQNLNPYLPPPTTDQVETSNRVDMSEPESESDVIKFLQYFGVNADNDTNTVYFENLNDFEKNLILYKEDILKKSLLYKIHDVYQGNDILSSFNLWAKMYIFERRSGVKSTDKQTMKKFSEQLGRYIYILIKLGIVMWILYILFKSKKPNNFINITFKIFIVYYLIFTFIREKQLLLRLRNAFFRSI